MTTRRILISLLAAGPLLFGTGAIATEYTAAAFESAQKTGKPILVNRAGFPGGS